MLRRVCRDTCRDTGISKSYSNASCVSRVSHTNHLTMALRFHANVRVTFSHRQCLHPCIHRAQHGCVCASGIATSTQLCYGNSSLMPLPFCRTRLEPALCFVLSGAALLVALRSSTDGSVRRWDSGWCRCAPLSKVPNRGWFLCGGCGSLGMCRLVRVSGMTGSGQGIILRDSKGE